MKIAPRKESEFVDELKEWFISADPKNSIFQKTYSVSGEPDLYFATQRKDGSLGEFRAEAKYVDKRPDSLRKLFHLLRGNQQRVIPRMAAASQIPIFLVTCVAGKEALWHLFDPKQCLRSIMGKVPPWECLILAHVSKRTPKGKWIQVSPDDRSLNS